jgi:hypothetical protein
MTTIGRNHHKKSTNNGNGNDSPTSTTTGTPTTMLDGTNLPSSSHGLPVTREWSEYIHAVTAAAAAAAKEVLSKHRRNKRKRSVTTHTALPQSLPSPSSLPFILEHHPTQPAKCIVVIEKEGIYQRLVQVQAQAQSSCIFVTAKGYPDLATRSCVASLCATFPTLPVVGICDCNPFGVHVLDTYRTGGGGGSCEGMAAGSESKERQMYYACRKLEWGGLLPSDVERLSSASNASGPSSTTNTTASQQPQLQLQLQTQNKSLPPSVYQSLTKRDYQKLDSLLDQFYARLEKTCEVIAQGERESAEQLQLQHSITELEAMRRLGYKLELESLHWLGIDFLNTWFATVVERCLLLNANNAQGPIQHGAANSIL